MRYAIELNERQSARVIEDAVRGQAQIVFEIAGDVSGPHCGQFSSAYGDLLLIKLSRPLPGRAPSMTGRYIDVQLHGDERYLFTTHIAQDSTVAGPYTIAIQRPGTVHLLQRRRFWRARLEPSSQVRLMTVLGAKTLAHDAAMLNVGADGLACRVEPRYASCYHTGDTVEVVFSLPDAQARFTFLSVVRSETPCSEGATILGLQFEDGLNNGSHQALRDWLVQRQYVRAPAEVGV